LDGNQLNLNLGYQMLTGTVQRKTIVLKITATEFHSVVPNIINKFNICKYLI